MPSQSKFEWRNIPLQATRSVPALCLLLGLLCCVFLILVFGHLPVATVKEIRRGERPITLIFRFDDYSSISSTDFEVQLFEAFRTHRVPVTIAVVPFAAKNIHSPATQQLFPLSARKIEILRAGMDQEFLEVALHGYAHQTIVPHAPGQYSEFADVSYDLQLQKIREAQQFLNRELKTQIKVFAPPWNRYDENTLRALAQMNFKVLSAGEKGLASNLGALSFVPQTCKVYELKRAIQAARSLRDGDPIVTVVMHQYDFRDVDSKQGRLTLEEFRKLLDWVTDQQDIRAISIRKAAEAQSGLNSDRLLSNHPGSLDRIAPPFGPWWGLLNSRLVYLNSAAATAVRLRRELIVGLGYSGELLICTLMSLAAGNLLFARFRLFGVVFVIGTLFSMIVVECYFAARHNSVSFRQAVILVGILGSLAGFWFSTRVVGHAGRIT